MKSTATRTLAICSPPELKEQREDAMVQFYRSIRENKPPIAGIEVAATAALTAILGREAICQRRIVTWKELGGDVDLPS